MSVNECPKCGADLTSISSENLSDCPNCGTDLGDVITVADEPRVLRADLTRCPRCGEDLTSIPWEARLVCPNCRVDLEDAIEEELSLEACPDCGADLSMLPSARLSECPICGAGLGDLTGIVGPDSTGRRRVTTDNVDFASANAIVDTSAATVGFYYGADDQQVAPDDPDVELLVETPGGNRVSFGYDADTWSEMADAVRAADGYVVCLKCANWGTPTVGIVDGDPYTDLPTCPLCASQMKTVELVRVSD